MGEIPILFRALKHPELGVAGYDGPDPSVTMLRSGHRREAGVKAFEVDTVWQKDVEITMRDGIVLRADIFRPAESDTNPVPALLPWSPYGKTGRGGYASRPATRRNSVDRATQNLGLSLNVMPGRMGVPKDVTSGYEKFEAPDPAEWTARGYAVVNVDSRGAWDSQGYLW